MTTAPNATLEKRAPWLPIRHFDQALAQDSKWTDAGSGIEQRDLGLGRASDGALQCRLLSATRADAVLPDAIGASGTHLHFFHVLEGRLTLDGRDGERVVLEAGDCVHQPALAQRQRVTFAGGTKVLEFAVPKQPTIEGKSFDLESADQAARPVVNRDVPAAYKKGDGPRSYFLYRDLGLSAATDRRIHIHALKATAPSAAGGTGAHRHTMCQLFYVMEGWADVQVQGQPDVRMHVGDAMCIAAGLKHNVPAFAADYTIIEICIPADYDTVDV